MCFIWKCPKQGGYSRVVQLENVLLSTCSTSKHWCMTNTEGNNAVPAVVPVVARGAHTLHCKHVVKAIDNTESRMNEIHNSFRENMDFIYARMITPKWNNTSTWTALLWYLIHSLEMESNTRATLSMTSSTQVAAACRFPHTSKTQRHKSAITLSIFKKQKHLDTQHGEVLLAFKEAREDNSRNAVKYTLHSRNNSRNPFLKVFLRPGISLTSSSQGCELDRHRTYQLHPILLTIIFIINSSANYLQVTVQMI